jgi:hypothetical protein
MQLTETIISGLHAIKLPFKLNWNYPNFHMYDMKITQYCVHCHPFHSGSISVPHAETLIYDDVKHIKNIFHTES